MNPAHRFAMPELFAQALDRFDRWLAEALDCGLAEPRAMTLATVSPDGSPAARIVLLRGHDARGFAFYTNSFSVKGQHLAAVPRAALCFHWDPLERQVRCEGAVEQVSSAESDQYWEQRARGSQLGAWASLQSEPLDRPETLAQRVAEVSQKYAGQPVPRPPHWLGYRVVPDRLEFWSGRPSRLHQREVYWREGSHWNHQWLYP